MLGLSLPDSLSPDDVRTAALVIGVAAIVLAVLVLRFVQKLMMKLTFTAVLLVIGAVAWFERADLADCAKSCECRVLGIDITIPTDDLPADRAVVCGDRAN